MHSFVLQLAHLRSLLSPIASNVLSSDEVGINRLRDVLCVNTEYEPLKDMNAPNNGWLLSKEKEIISLGLRKIKNRSKAITP